MSLKTSWWRCFLGLAPHPYLRAIEILRARYIEERQHVTRFTQHAQKMQYLQFRAKLLSIAAEEAKHAEWIAEKINLLGGQVPEVPAVPPTEQNSWQYLLTDLEEEKHCSEELLEQIQTLRPELPQVAAVLQRIYEDGSKHRQTIREMLIRSDPQAVWPG